MVSALLEVTMIEDAILAGASFGGRGQERPSLEHRGNE